MQIVPTSLVRISRYYMVTAAAYLLITILTGIYRSVAIIPDPRVHWIPAVFGWISFPIMGAYYQFFPTLQGRDLRMEHATLPQYGLMNLGLVGMMAAAWTGARAGMVASVTIYGVGTLLFAVIIAANVDFSRFNLTLRFYLASLTYFVVAVGLLVANVWGFAPAWAQQPFMLHLAAFGWALVAIMGAAYSLVPMLQLKELRHPKLAEVQFYFVNAGFLFLLYSLARFDLRLVAIAGTVVLAALILFAYIVLSSLVHGPARLKKLDISVVYIVVGMAYLFLAVLAGIAMGALVRFDLRPLHIHLALIGLVTNTIIGSMYHVVPFVVWWEVYAPRMGLEDVPTLKQLFDERSARIQLYTLNIGLAGVLGGMAVHAGILTAAGGVVILLTVLAFIREMMKVVHHRRKLSEPAQEAPVRTVWETK